MPAHFFDSLYFPLSGFLIALVFLMYCLSKMLESFMRVAEVSAGAAPAGLQESEAAPAEMAVKQAAVNAETAGLVTAASQTAVVRKTAEPRPDANPAAQSAAKPAEKAEPAKAAVVSAAIPVPAQVFVPAAEVLKADLLKADKNAAARPLSGSASGIASEIADFRVQLDEMKYMVEQRKSLHEKQIVDIIRNINGIVNRLETLEPEYLAEIQPSLQYLVFELENIRAAGGAAAPAAKK